MFDPANHPIAATAVAFAAAAAAGAVNAVAGGGTLLTYSTLNLFLGIPGKTANATNTMALWPASLTGAFGFRRTVPSDKRLVFLFLGSSILGGVTGALLLVYTKDQIFEKIVPWLILMAALLFILQERIQKLFGVNSKDKEDAPVHAEKRNLLFPLIFQFLVGVYGGYFGAGIGIIMLGALSLMRIGDIYQMNFLKNLGALFINGSAVIVLGTNGLVQLPLAMVMAAGAMLGGYTGAGVARKIGPKNLRRAISGVGLVISGFMIYKQFIQK